VFDPVQTQRVNSTLDQVRNFRLK